MGMKRLFRITSCGRVIADKVGENDMLWIIEGFFKEYDANNASVSITAVIPSEDKENDQKYIFKDI